MLIVPLLAAVAMLVPLAAQAAGPAYPQAWGAMQQYLNGATASCAAQGPGQQPTPGAACTQLETFSVSMRVEGTNRYLIRVSNMLPRNNFRYFAYLLPDGMTLTGVQGSWQGHCGTNGGMISCMRVIATRGAQRDLIVEFTATGRAPIRAKKGYWIHFGFVTPFLDQPQSFSDVPICDLGEKSTRVHPCLK